MNEMLTLTLSWLAGGALGAGFFGGLWWTVQRSVRSRRPELWVLGSLLGRMSLMLVGLYFVSGRDWRRLLSCLLGVLMARVVVTWVTRRGSESRAPELPEAGHAPYSR